MWRKNSSNCRVKRAGRDSRENGCKRIDESFRNTFSKCMFRASEDETFRQTRLVDKFNMERDRERERERKKEKNMAGQIVAVYICVSEKRPCKGRLTDDMTIV